ncbi:MAG: hypothetical protein JWL83_3113 [Actinomycetia bacterium]|nr:hypothetical protein [Actinomycetes bacterium]
MLVDGRYDAFILWAEARDDARNNIRGDIRTDNRDHTHDHARENSHDRGHDRDHDDHAAACDSQRDDANFDTDVEFQLAITAGAHKGEVIELIASNFATRDPIELVGLPCTLVVDNGTPRIEA